MGTWVVSIVSAVMNSVTVDMDVKISLGDPAFIYFMYILSSGIAGSYGGIMFNFCGTSIYGQRSLNGYSPWGRKRVVHGLATKQQSTLIGI